ncbi:MAG: CDP-alcohol phosphatidyltransferase family protein [Gemmatimonadota bacterium]|nr:CDP-alcohol phosphatidyltransferase family protein [Gemmatimonadota bacterium]
MLANFLSVLRVLLIPFLLYFIAQGPVAQFQAVLLLLIAGITDIGDGWVARRYNQVSRLGKILDPLADKIFLACLLGGLVLWRDLPLWLLGMLFVRDLGIVLVGGLLLRLQGLVIAANRWGKYTTLCMVLTALSYVIETPASLRTGLVMAAAALVVVSSLSYAQLALRLSRREQT